jgi:hypothetical protein
MRRIAESNPGSLARVTLIGLPVAEDNIVQQTSPVLQKLNVSREQYCMLKSAEFYNQFVLFFSPSTNEAASTNGKRSQRK